MFEIIPNWHPFLVHFTVALWSLATFFYLSAPLVKAPLLHNQWLILARWNLWIGALSAVLSAGFGFWAFNTVAHDAASHAAMELHRNWVLAALALFLPLAVWSFWREHSASPKLPGRVFLTLLLLAWTTLAVAGWRGAEVVYRYGIGVKSLPKVEQSETGHAHDAGAHADRMEAEPQDHAHDADNH